MPTAHAPRRTRNKSNTAAAFFGVIGVPDPGAYGPQLGDGGMREFCRQANASFDRLAETRRPELRAFAREERYFAAALR